MPRRSFLSFRLRPVAWVAALALTACDADNSPAPFATVDQVFAPGAADAVTGIGQVGAYAQTFTAGRTGTLSSIDLILAAQGSDDVIRIDVRSVVGGSPSLDDGVVLGSRQFTASSFPATPSQAFVIIDFRGQGISCVAGQSLAIVVTRVSGAGASAVLWITENQATEDYVAGSGFQRTAGSGTGWTPLANDFYFRTQLLD